MGFKVTGKERWGVPLLTLSASVGLGRSQDENSLYFR